MPANEEQKGLGIPPVVRRQLAMLRLIRWGTIFNGAGLFLILAALIYIIKSMQFLIESLELLKLLVEMHN